MSPLRRMAEKRIFFVERTDDGFRVVEGCDGHFKQDLTADELRELGHELIAVSYGAEAPEWTG